MQQSMSILFSEHVEYVVYVYYFQCMCIVLYAQNTVHIHVYRVTYNLSRFIHTQERIAFCQGSDFVGLVLQLHYG